jgi:phage shock protein PspC (stress-responsive transcriptional regulator)
MASKKLPSELHMRMVRIAFTIMAVVSLAMGLSLYILADKLAIDAPTARLMATAFIIAAVVDTFVLYFWDWLFKPKR